MVKTRGMALVFIVVAAAGLIATVAVRYTAAGEAKEPCCFTNPALHGRLSGDAGGG